MSGSIESEADGKEPDASLATACLDIRNLIYTVRGMQVMLDSDLASLYGVETKAVNRAAKRNEGRFPEDFRFQLKRDEAENLRCQIGTLQGQGNGSGVGRTYLPHVYTEQGVAMLSAVLRSDVAVEVSLCIMRAFVEMRYFVANNAMLFDQVRSVELRQLEYQKTTGKCFERIFDYMEVHEERKQRVFFEGQVFDALEFLVSLVQRAKKKIVLIDGYVDERTLSILAKKNVGVGAAILTRKDSRLTEHDIEAFNAQYPLLEIRRTDAFHDRFLIIDDVEGYLVGASLKDAGKKCFAVTRLEDGQTVQDILSRLS